jgi:hypothetical protein
MSHSPNLRLALLAFAFAFAFAFVAPQAALALEHPKPLEPADGCERFIGTATGNSSMRVVLRLCPTANGLRGEAQCSSLQSGWSVREVRGTRSGSAIRLVDVRLVEERPNPGWRFCTIDRWELERRGDRLDGTYRSEACTDTATVRLRRMEDADTQGETSAAETQTEAIDEGRTPGPTPSPPATPPAEPTHVDVGDERRTADDSIVERGSERDVAREANAGCGCASSPVARGLDGVDGVCLAAMVLWSLRRRH